MHDRPTLIVIVPVCFLLNIVIWILIFYMTMSVIIRVPVVLFRAKIKDTIYKSKIQCIYVKLSEKYWDFWNIIVESLRKSKNIYVFWSLLVYKSNSKWWNSIVDQYIIRLTALPRNKARKKQTLVPYIRKHNSNKTHPTSQYPKPKNRACGL